METVCNRCVMDTTAKNIRFNEKGICNFCLDYEKSLLKLNAAKFNLDELVERIRKDGKGKEYDCIVGVSGGVDSSYVLLKAKELGLRPLAVHLDNGWNSDLATKNISNLVEKLNADLFTYVIDWEEYKDLQKSFFKANVVDIEMLMDNAMLSVNYSQAKKYGIKNILSGFNASTEGMNFPDGWNHLKFDAKNIRNIQKKFGTKKIKTFPIISTIDFIKYEKVSKIHWYPFLDFFNYNKEDALKELEEKVGYIRYPYKHYESVFTRFYQAYILPKKFNIDKRKLHLSTLIISNQMSRDEAMLLLKQSPYPNVELEKSDKDFVLKKLDFTEESFENYIKSPAVPHEAYGSEKKFFDFCFNFYHKFIKKD